MKKLNKISIKEIKEVFEYHETRETFYMAIIFSFLPIVNIIVLSCLMWGVVNYDKDDRRMREAVGGILGILLGIMIFTPIILSMI